MNRQNPGIEWTHFRGRPGYTANPVKGCAHECKWRMPDGSIAQCYAKSIAEKFPGVWYKEGFEHISFDPSELREIRKLKTPSGIFIDSMSDLFGRGVKTEWILEVFGEMNNSDHHVFFSLTKNAPRLKEFHGRFPENLLLGISSSPTFMFGKELTASQQQAFLDRSLAQLMETDHPHKWISIEPLSWDVSEILERYASGLCWAVIGAASNGAKTYQPDPKHLSNVMDVLVSAGSKIFFKGNLNRDLAIKHAGGWREEYPNIL